MPLSGILWNFLKTNGKRGLKIPRLAESSAARRRFRHSLVVRTRCRLPGGRKCQPVTLKRVPDLWNRSLCAGSLNSPFTAADEKIPLSVVRVNKKPQHLVFSCHFAHLLSKHRHLPVESFKAPCAARVCTVRIAPARLPTLFDHRL